jgi:hypothetical protein
MTMGPVQLLVVGFGDPAFTGEIQAELDRLRADDVVRVLDLLVVHKDADGNLSRPAGGGLPGAGGAIAGALAGLEQDEDADGGTGARTPGFPGDNGEDVWYIDDAIERDSAAAVVVLEHRWAIPLHRAILRAGGNRLLAAEWIHRDDLVDIGMLAPDGH